MRLPELVSAAIGQTNFKPHRPFEVYMRLGFGEIHAIRLIELGSTGPHSQLKESDLKYMQVGATSWSMGCKSLSGWVIAPTLEAFCESVQALARVMVLNHMSQLESEMDRYVKAIKFLKTY